MVALVVTGRPKYPRACGSLRPTGEGAAEVVVRVAVCAVSYWLAKADEADGEDRIACLQTADAILRPCRGLSTLTASPFCRRASSNR